ncbi:MAG: MarR family winged helix-turn-helix transcriptional regulator [Defluviitaleaceae bacterium]|nr:MarR family winged helix-turn-helix transcriptional regulator [Defluviitaleaceae bacterium]
MSENNTRKKALSNLKEVWHKIDNLYSLYAKKMGLNLASLLVLQLLYDAAPAKNYTQKELCEKLALPKQFISYIMKSFWQQGFVEMREGKDRRNKDIIFTPLGKEFAKRVLKPLEDAELAVWNCFTDKEVLNIAETMEKFAKSFEDVLKNN